MKKLTFIKQLFCVMVLPVILSCTAGSTPSAQKKTETQAPGPDTIRIGQENLDRIIGQKWGLEQLIVTGESILLAEERPYLQFESDGRLSGSGGVNRVFGQLGFDSQGKVRLPPLGTTMMAGPDELMQQESLFLKGFSQISRLNLDPEKLTAVSEDGQTRLVFRAR